MAMFQSGFKDEKQAMPADGALHLIVTAYDHHGDTYVVARWAPPSEAEKEFRELSRHGESIMVITRGRILAAHNVDKQPDADWPAT